MSGLIQFCLDLEQALLTINKLRVQDILNHALADYDRIQVVDELIVPTLDKIGKGWNEGTVALSQVYMSGRICEEVIDNLIPTLSAEQKKCPPMAIVVLEDYHVLGKRVVYSVLRASGFSLLDYGHGITVEEVVQRVQADEVEILLISTLMLRAALRVQEVRRRLTELGVNTKIIVGGAPFLLDAHLWQKVGADAMGKNATEVNGIIAKFAGDWA